MSANRVSRQGNAGRTSDIACYSCRRRKVKCDRRRPHCSMCEQTEQLPCIYPQGPLKPGPKIGTWQQRRRRQLESRVNDSDSWALPQLTQRNAGTVNQQNSTKSTVDSPWSLDRETSSSRDGPATPAVGGAEEWNNRRRDSQLSIYDLSFILHPSHEASTPESEGQSSTAPTRTYDESSEPVLLAKACSMLGVTPDVLKQMIQVYFNNPVPVSLFHEPSFWEKIHNISSAVQTQALLAAMMAYAARFYFIEKNNSTEHNPYSVADMDHRPVYFLNLALKYIDDALAECGDEPPPLCILQALIITGHCQLTEGVRGKAWRSLGICIRLAYELNLHVVDAVSPGDATEVDEKQWCIDEEKRRAWWAVWEMDIFASTIRRCPSGIDRMQIETLLPAEDQFWFQNKPRRSCFLERDVVYTWKALQQCGNQSPKAWYLVINCLMQEARHLSSPRGVRSPPSRGNRSNKGSGDSVKETREKLATLLNSIHCFVLALPSHLWYRNQYLDFAARKPGQTVFMRRLHSSIYSIYMMTQLAILMIHHYDAFGGPARVRRPAQSTNNHDIGRSVDDAPKPFSTYSPDGVENLALIQYFEAADKILTIVQRSSPDHVQYINPCLANTIWLASAVQLVRKEFVPPGTNRDLIKSKFEALYMTYKKSVEFWDIQTTLQQNLELLEAQLGGFHITRDQNHDQPSDSTAQDGDQKVTSDTESCTDDDYVLADARQETSHTMYPVSDFLPTQSQHSVNNTIQQHMGFSTQPFSVFQSLYPYSSSNGWPRQKRTHCIQEEDQVHMNTEYHALNTSSVSMLGFPYLPSQFDKQCSSDSVIPVALPAVVDTTQPPGVSFTNETHALGFEQNMDGRDMDLLYVDELLFGMVPIPALDGETLGSGV